MSIGERAEKAERQWIETGKFRHKVRMVVLYQLWSMLTPTPSLGFLLGGLSTALVMWLAAPLLVERPFLAAVLIGAEVAALAWVWQIVYDRYWEKQ